MKKLLELLGKAKHYVGLAIKYLGKILSLLKSTEKELDKKDEPKE